MSDYAQGGWAKLDCEAAWNLAEVASQFPKTKMEQYLRMLLILYSSMSRDGTTNIGYRTLAERAEVTENQAYYFMKKLEDDGVLLNLGIVITPGGNYTKRQFAWLSSQEIEGAGKKSSTPAGKSPEKVKQGAGKSPENFKHIRYTRSISDRDGGASKSAPPIRDKDVYVASKPEFTEKENPFVWMPPPTE